MNERTADSLLELVSRVTEEHFPVGALIYGSRVAGYARKDSLYDCMVVCDYPGGTRNYRERFDDGEAAILEIDNELFQLDIKRGALGEFIVARMLFPYVALKGVEFLTENEIELKERVVKEETEDLIRRYREASRGLMIDPEYYALSHLSRRSKIYPPLRYSYLNTFSKDLRERNMSKVMTGYRKAIDRLIHREILDESKERVIIRDEFIDRVLSRKAKDRVINVAEISRRALYSYLMHGRAGIVSSELISRELASKVWRELRLPNLDLQVEDPKVHLSLRTASGSVRLDERGTIKDIILKMKPDSKITILPLGGALNEVYLVSANGDKLVVKIFTDWHGFKWFTLNLVTLGTKLFSVSGKARLSNEFGMSHLLKRRGIRTPEILHVSLPNKILVETYIEGGNVVDLVKLIVKREECPERLYDDVAEIGQTMAKIHSLGIQIGDSKPENFLRDPAGSIYIIDLEQARKGGDFAWDIAEFLYYSAHYATAQTPGIRRLTESFVGGYIQKGDPAHVRKAAGMAYLKVFSLWALPQINYAVSDVLRKATQ